MEYETKAFHELILQANRAHKAYNTSGPSVAQNALYDLRSLALALMLRLANKSKTDE